jgi:hypothetical protein
MIDQKYARQYKKALMEARKVIESELFEIGNISESADSEFEPSLSLPGNLLTEPIAIAASKMNISPQVAHCAKYYYLRENNFLGA